MSNVPPPPILGFKEEPENVESAVVTVPEETQPVPIVDEVVIVENQTTPQVEEEKESSDENISDEPKESSESNVTTVSKKTKIVEGVLRFTLAAALLVGACVLGYFALEALL